MKSLEWAPLSRPNVLAPPSTTTRSSVRAADDGDTDRECRSIRGDRPERHLHRVVEGVVAGPELGDAGFPRDEFRGGRGPGADDADVATVGPDRGGGVTHGGGLADGDLLDRGPVGRGVGVAGMGEHAVEPDARQVRHGRGERTGVGRQDAAPAEAALDLDPDAHGQAGGGRRAGDRAGALDRIDRQDQPGRAASAIARASFGGATIS